MNTHSLLAATFLAGNLLQAQMPGGVYPDTDMLDAFDYPAIEDPSTSIHYVDVEPNLNLSSGDFSFDLNDDGVDDMMLSYLWSWGYGGWSCYYDYWRFSIEISDGDVAYDQRSLRRRWAQAFRRATASTISSCGPKRSVSGRQGRDTLVRTAPVTAIAIPIPEATLRGSPTPFSPASDSWTEARTTMGGACFSVNGMLPYSPYIEILDYALETVPDKAIRAGDTGAVESCPAPENLTATITSGSGVMLTWDPVLDAFGYRIQLRKSGGSDSKFLASATSSKWVAREPTPGLTYEWRVRAACTTDTSAWSAIDYINAPLARKVDLQVSVLPNPADKNLQIHVTGSNERIEIELIDAVGRILLVQPITDGYLELDVSVLPAGVYFIRLHGSEGTTVHRVLIE